MWGDGGGTGRIINGAAHAVSSVAAHECQHGELRLKHARSASSRARKAVGVSLAGLSPSPALTLCSSSSASARAAARGAVWTAGALVVHVSCVERGDCDEEW